MLYAQIDGAAEACAIGMIGQPAATRESEQQPSPALIVAIKRRLIEEGYEVSNVDPYLDESTRRAIRNYQRRMGLPQTGYPDKRTTDSLLAY